MLKNINIVIPMAGKGERISSFGIKTPKPLLKINEKYMIEHALDSLGIKGNFIFITRKYDNDRYNLLTSKIIKKVCPESIEIKVENDHRGPAEAVMFARDYIDNEYPLIVYNCDQLINWDHNDFLNFIDKQKCDGAIVLFNSEDDRYSYAKMSGDVVVDIAEKVVISKNALAGVHYFKKGKDFVSNADKALKYFSNKEVYISQVYSKMLRQKNIIGYNLKNDGFFNLGDIDSILKYQKSLNNILSPKGKSGASLLIFEDEVLKIGSDRVGEQGEWIKNHYNEHLPYVSSISPNFYVMNRLSQINDIDNCTLFLNKLIDILKNNFWNKPAENYFNLESHLERLRGISYSNKIYGDMFSIQEKIDWNKLTRGLTHGDPILENIMLGDDLVLIDPIPSSESIPDVISVDMGRILQSLVGYEYLLYGDSSLNECDISLVFNGLNSNDIYAAKYWCIFHLLRSLKYLDGNNLDLIKSKIELLINNFNSWIPIDNSFSI